MIQQLITFKLRYFKILALHPRAYGARYDMIRYIDVCSNADAMARLI